MYIRKLCQFCPRLFGHLQLRASALGQNATLCNQSVRCRNKLPQDQPTVCLSSVPKSAAEKGNLVDISQIKAKEFLDNLDEDGLQRMKDIKAVMEMMRLENMKVPDELSPLNWKVLLTDHHTYSARRKYLGKLFLDECSRRNRKEKKLLKQKAAQEKLETVTVKGPPEVSIHIPARDIEIKQWKRLQALKSDVNVVFDLDFKQTSRERVHTLSQIQRIWFVNINHRQPLNLHLTSIDKNERLLESLQCSKSANVNYHEESFVEIFPKQDLVYLTPDGPPLFDFDPSCTYVVGGLVDLSGRSRETYGKARSHGIRTASFPLNRYCDFSYTERAKHILTLDCVHGILLDMFLYHSWSVALRKNLNERYVFRKDLQSGEFVENRKKMMEKKMFSRFQRNERAMR